MKTKKSFLFFIFLFSFAVLCTINTSLIQSQSSEDHVYYGYIPPTSNIGNVKEILNGKTFNYSVPAGFALLDVLGLNDRTNISLYDLASGQLLNSTIVNKLQKVTFFIRYGTYFKLVASSRIFAMISGGNLAYDGDSSYGGFATFYPSVEGGFRGRQFIFIAAPPTHPYAYYTQYITYNFYLMALESSQWTLKDFTGKFSVSDSTEKQKTSYVVQLATRQLTWSHMGTGYDMRYILQSSGDVIVQGTSVGQFLYVPAVTGGYVGKLFFVSDQCTYPGTGRSVILVIVPLEPGKVTIYDKDLNVLAEHTFSTQDVSTNQYWYKTFGTGRFTFIVESTGNITLLATQTNVNESIDYIDSGITFLGSRPNQELKFFTPSSALVFSPENQTITVDGETRSVARDEVITLGSGVHSVKGTGVLIVEVLSPGPTGFQRWGSALIEPLDITKSFPAIELTHPTPYLLYVSIGAILVIVILVVYFLRIRKK